MSTVTVVIVVVVILALIAGYKFFSNPNNYR